MLCTFIFNCTVFKENVEEQQKSQATSQSDHPDYLGAIFDYESRAQGVHLLLESALIEGVSDHVLQFVVGHIPFLSGSSET